MNLPSAEQYIQIVERKTPGSLATLHNHRFILKEPGKPWYEKGTYAIVFKTENNSKYYAVRFFLDSEPEVFERYKQIKTYLDTKSVNWKVPFEFLDKEIYIGGEYYPAVKMDWTESLSLSQYLDLIISDPSSISRLQLELVTLSQNLEKNGTGHGNLNMKHIRFVKQAHDYALKLIDYDSLFIPAFKGKDSISPGTAGFQHPMRLASDFSETIDRFSFWIFLTALEAFKTDPSLWKNARQNGFNKEEQVLFTYRDLAFPRQSASFQLLRNYNNKALNFYTEKLVAFCNSTSLNDVETPVIYEDKDFHSTKTKQESVYAPKEAGKITEPELMPVNIVSGKAVTHSEKAIHKTERLRKKENDLTNLKTKVQSPEDKELYIPAIKNKKKPIAAIVLIAVALLSVAAYFVWQNQTGKSGNENALSQQTTLQTQQQVPEHETVFTPANSTQFLFQLYQSYNKRDLQAILSNYADSLTQYYDAGAMTKAKLNTIINDLFIKPDYYECKPDLRTLQLNAKGNVCLLTIAINETIKKDRQSKTENYDSKIEYTVDTAFKILSEKNIE